jgi:predicted alternative tryptophan synthase beta-subunit
MSETDENHYVVVFRDAHWQVSHKGIVEAPFTEKEKAIAAAIESAKADHERGVDSIVLVERDDRSFEPVWAPG